VQTWETWLHTCASVTKQYNLVPTNGRWNQNMDLILKQTTLLTTDDNSVWIFANSIYCYFMVFSWLLNCCHVYTAPCTNILTYLLTYVPADMGQLHREKFN